MASDYRHILLTGATGYVGKRLLLVLLNQGYKLTCCVRNTTRFQVPAGYDNQINILQYDFGTPPESFPNLEHVDAAYYMIHSLTSSTRDYREHEKVTAKNFRDLAEHLRCKQVIYLGGIANENTLSEHLTSRKEVEDTLKGGRYATTILRAAIIVGSGSASFEIIRDLVEKLPVMIAPKWVNTECQPIAIRNVIQYLVGVLCNERTFNNTFDIGGPKVLTYKQMLLDFGKERGLKRLIFSVPVMTPRLSSYWLYIITSTNYNLAVNLVKSMSVRVVCSDNRLQEILQIKLIPYREAVRLAFDRIEQNIVISSWKDALSSGRNDNNWGNHIEVPVNGCLFDRRELKVGKKEAVLQKIWSIGGDTGWYYANFLWQLRGFLDKIFGGVGLRRGRTNQDFIETGQTLDFWRVLIADKGEARLLLYAEMKLPGEAWLEFKLEPRNGELFFIQQATFRPLGLIGRLYWFVLSPFHNFIFSGMARKIAQG